MNQPKESVLQRWGLVPLRVAVGLVFLLHGGQKLFGFGLSGKVFLVALAVFLVVIVYAVDGSRRVAAELERTATMLGMSGAQRFRHVVLPGALTEVLIGSRVSLMSGWGTVIVAELAW